MEFMLRTAFPPTVRNVGRDRLLRAAKSSNGAMASRRFIATAFCSAERLSRSFSEISGTVANRLDCLGSERAANAVPAGPDNRGRLRNFSWASADREDSAYSRLT